jgi:hypothetical protein
MPNQECDYGFEQYCRCIAPENVWLCCGGAVACLQPITDGMLCCGSFGGTGLSCPGACDQNGMRQVCTCKDYHFHCVTQSCRDGGA